MHNHADPANVLGLAHLENRNEGVYAFCEFNDTESGKTARELVKHGDVQSLSIFANQLKQAGHDVVHGIIREVSLVLAGANPGAFKMCIRDRLGVGPSKGFMIEDKSATWKDFISDESKYMLVKSYMHLKVKLLFDPPLSSAVLECYKTQISEYEWRLNVAAENDDTDPDEPEHYSGSYEVTPKAHQTQTLDTSGRCV